MISGPITRARTYIRTLSAWPTISEQCVCATQSVKIMFNRGASIIVQSIGTGLHPNGKLLYKAEGRRWNRTNLKNKCSVQKDFNWHILL